MSKYLNIIRHGPLPKSKSLLKFWKVLMLYLSKAPESVQIFIWTHPIMYNFEFNVTQTRIERIFTGINQSSSTDREWSQSTPHKISGKLLCVQVHVLHWVAVAVQEKVLWPEFHTKNILCSDSCRLKRNNKDA